MEKERTPRHRRQPQHTAEVLREKPAPEFRRPDLVIPPDDFSEVVSYQSTPPGEYGHPQNESAAFPYEEPAGTYDSTRTYSSQQEHDGHGYAQSFQAEDSSENSYRLPSLEPVATRPRRRKKIDKRALLEQRLSLLLLGVLTLCFFGAAVLMAVLPRSTVSKIEKRELAKFPSFSLSGYFSGDYTAGIATFYDDTVPNRDGLKNIGNNFKSVFGLPKVGDSVEFVGNVIKLNQKDQPAPTPANEGSQLAAEPSAQPAGAPASPASLEGAAGRHMDTATPPPTPFTPPEAQEANMTENGLIVLKLDGHYRALELFGGGSGDSYAQALNGLQGQLGENVSIWSMPAPLACEFYTPSDYADYTSSQSDCFEAVAGKLNPGIRSINICPVLGQHVGEPIYCRTDHHWQPLGAYYAAQAFANAAGVPFDDIGAYKEEKIPEFVGSMYAFSGSANLLNDPEDFIYYRPAKDYQAAYYNTSFEFLWDEDDFFQEGASGSDAYMILLGGDEYIVKATTQAATDRKLLVIKDSYGNAVPPFLTGSFKQIYVADMRYMQRNLVSFIRDMGITDVLFTMSSYSLVGEAADNLENLITQNAGETVEDSRP